MNEIKTLDGLGASPAPWKVNINNDVESADGIVMALTSDLSIPSEYDEMSNANLIAAAPELYEACRKLVEWDGMRDASIEDIIAEAKTACAKAGGAR